MIKHTLKYIFATVFILVCHPTLRAQVAPALPDADSRCRKGGGGFFCIDGGGVRFGKAKPDSSQKIFSLHFGMLDLSINSLIDKTDYNSWQAQTFLHVDRRLMNADLFSLQTGKSININIYPVVVKAQLYISDRQKISLATGAGLQCYNFRFDKPVYYEEREGFRPAISTWRRGVSDASISFSKNKLAFSYLTVPLMISARTKVANSNSGGYWLTYGAGLSGGYLLSSWTKQVSEERGKYKYHDRFNFRNTNFCVNGELGLDGFIRLYASYQLTSLHEDALDQHPLCIGVRFLGI